MRSPVHAMLWELWRVTRGEIAWRLALGTVGGLAFIAFVWTFETTGLPRYRDFGAVVAMVLIVMPHYLGWIFLPRLNRGRPGFPFYLQYTRPVRTSLIVGLPLAYLTIVPAAIYLVSALLLRMVFGYPFPLLPVAAWIAALNVVLAVIFWSARNMVVLMLVYMVPSVGWIFFAIHRLTSFPVGLRWYDSPSLWPTIFDFPLTDYAFIALIGLTSFGVAVVTVGRQRHSGDARAAVPRNLYGQFQVWFVRLFGLPCPTSSATWAQVWFDLKPWLPMLVVELVLTGVSPLLFALSVRMGGWLGPIASMCLGLGAMFLFPLGANAFHIRGFDATQPSGSARLAALKLCVRSICVLAALAMVVTSFWVSLPSIAFKNSVAVRSWQRGVESAVEAMTGYQHIALAVVVAMGVVVMVASVSALTALWVRYSRRLNIAGSILLLYGLALALLGLAAHLKIVPALLPVTVFRATPWIFAGALFFATVYLLWSGFVERFLTVRYVCGAFVLAAIFAVAWLTMLRAVGVSTNTVSMMSPMILPLMASVLAPWSLSRIRHM